MAKIRGRLHVERQSTTHFILRSIDLCKKSIRGAEALEGLLGVWQFGGATNAAIKGFNNNVRTMLRQAYGYRDDEYMILKICDLPIRKLQVGI